MFDGLDEVSDLKIREIVQDAIRSFIEEHRDTDSKGEKYNRFLVTSRVAGYDQSAFPDYLR
jgi:predicted NACHT family NTPase